MKVDLLDPVIEASPGQTAICRVRVLNDSKGPAAYRLRIVGLNDHEIEYPLGYDALPAGTEASFDVAVEVPKTFAAGRHSLAVEIVSDRRGERPALADMTVQVASINKVALRINPSSIIGRLRGRFEVEIDNREPRPVELDLHGEGRQLDVALAQTRVRLRPGDTVAVAGSVKGERRLVRDPMHHMMTIVATGRSAPVYAEAAFEQRPLVPRRLRTALAIFTVLAVWAGILVVGTYWWTHRDDNKNDAPAALVDLDGDGKPDQPLGELPVDTSATGEDGGGGSGGGSGGGGAEGSESETKVDKRTATTIAGTVKAGKTGEDAGVQVSLAPAVLGSGEPPEAQAAALARGGSVGDVAGGESYKIWGARYNRYTPAGVSEIRRTESIRSAESNDEGAWSFPDVLIRDNYEITFAKPGFNTKAYIVTPPEDGKAVELEVQLDPASGSVSGTVTGPTGALGGVDIVITDGTLTFSTSTSSDAGSLGQFSVGGLSTPNTYTLTATLRGYGTEVVQLPMTAGQKRGGVNIVMKAGVGSISGHVTANTAPLGGVTITASMGDLTRSTTSLTLGDAGFFSMPQLTIPGTYTVMASAPGYVSQTREVVLAGNAADVDFSLVRTTASIIGLVSSNVNGSQPGVGITVTHDDLSFTSTTAAAPSPGSFRIDELPPGDYLVRFERYDHEGVSHQVTVNAGDVLDMGTIMMTFRARPPLAETGSIAVAVKNSAGVELTGATVELMKISDGSLVRKLDDSTANVQSSFLFENVPIGTYTVRVTRRSYRTATQRITVGLDKQSTTFNLLRLGQVNGRVVDATTGLQLRNYIINIYRLNPDGTRQLPEVENIPIPSNFPPNADGDFLWESEENSLVDGTYEIEILPPPGYSVQPQVLDPDLPLDPMKFVISPTDEDALRLNDILLDPYPSLTGRLFSPIYTGVGNPPTLAPLDNNAVVTLDCPGATGPATAVMSDAVAPVGIDTYTFTKEIIDQNELVGSCTLTVQSPSFRTVTMPMPAPLEISSNGVPTDQQLNVALTLAVDDAAGTIGWHDYGLTGNPEILIPTAVVQTISDAITSFAPGTGVDPPTPVITPAGIVGTNIGGTFSFTGPLRQVFGQTTYEVSDPNFQTGTFTVTIDEAQRTVVAVSGLSLTAASGGGIQVELNPLDGSASGQITIDTERTTPNYAAVGISGVGPKGVTATPAVDPATGAVTAPDLDAGTWTFTVTAPAHHVFAPSAPTTITVPVPPNAPSTIPISSHLVELASLDVNLVLPGRGGAFTGGAGATVTLTPVAGGSAQPITIDGNGQGHLDDLGVDLSSPLSIVQYRMAISLTGYDTEYLPVTIAYSNGSTPTTNDQTKGDNILIDLVAGRTATVTITMEAFGTITGEILGLVGDDAADSPKEQLALGSVTATVVRVKDEAGNTPAATSPQPQIAVDPANADNGFIITGPPGLYAISFTHPHFTTTFSAPAVDPASGFYVLANAPITFADPFLLLIDKGFIDVAAVGAAGAPIDGADVTVTFNQPPGYTPRDVVDDVTVGGAVQFQLIPGNYEIEVRKRDSLTGLDERFPVIVDVEVPRGGGTVTVVAHLAEVGGTIGGNIVARNDEGDNVLFPVDAVITRTYSAEDAEVDSAPVDNEATEANLNVASAPTPSVPLTRGATTDAQTFTFEHLPTGLHRLTFSEEDGYALIAPIDVPVLDISGTSVTPDPVVYSALPVKVIIDLRAASGDVLSTDYTPTVQLIGPDAADVALTAVNDGTNRFTFTVTPETAPYKLTVTNDPYHEDLAPYDIQVDPSADTLPKTVTLTADAARISGTVTRDDAESSSSTLTGLNTPAQVALERNDAGTWTPAGTTTPVNGAYHFDVTTAGDYRITVTQSEYATRTLSIPGIVLGGEDPDHDLTIPKTATMVITINPPQAAQAASFAQSITPATGDAGTCATDPGPPQVSTCAYTLLDPDVGYSWSFTATSDNYKPASTSLTAANVHIGGSHTDAVTLAQRDISITVVTDGSANDSKTATVVMHIPVGSADILPTHDNTTSVYDFIRLPLGAGEVVISKNLYRTRTIAFAADGSPPPPAPWPSVTIHPLVTITGTIKDKNGNNVQGASVSLQGSSIPAVQSQANGSYTITGVDVGTWTITAVKDGVGAGTDPQNVTVNATSANSVAAGDLTLQPRDVVYTFNVTVDGSSAPATSATVTVNPGSSQTQVSSGADGLTPLTFTFKEDALPASTLPYRVTKSGYLTVNSTFGTPTDHQIPVTLYASPTVTGSVTGATGSVSVFVCKTGPASSCNNGNGDDTLTRTVTGSSFSISGFVDPGTYYVRAVDGGKEGTGSFVISATGGVTTTPSPFEIPLT